MEGMEIRSPRVLVADDDENVREVTREMLRGLGMEADSVRARGELVDRYKRALLAGRRYDLVILGVYHPLELGGGTLIVMLQEIDPQVKVLISTATLGGTTFPSQCCHGIVGYLDRPYRTQDLMRAVNEALRQCGNESVGPRTFLS